nr:DNA helicase [Tanacetum cinerariifolium]
MSVLRSHAGWKTKHFRGMTLKEIKEKFIPVWKQLEDFVPMSLTEEGKRMKRKGLKLDEGSPKRMKTSEDVSEEDLKGMIEDLHQLWALVKETLSIRQATKDKEKELWADLKRLFEPDFEDQLWTHNQNLMHDPLDWKLYDTCGVHYVFTKDQEIFMLVERDYPLRRGPAIMMICNKLQDFITWLGISLETTTMSTMDLDGETFLTESDYKNLNKNDIEDMYLLIVNNKVDDYAETAKTRPNTFETTLAEKKRKRKVEVIQEVFVKENIMVDDMQRSLSLPEGVVGRAGLVIKELEAEIFLYNGNFDLQVYDELIYEIESRPDFVQAMEIVAKTLDVLDIIEFQKIGLPHYHTLLWVSSRSKITDACQIDDYISAEIPNPAYDPTGYKVVTELMMHGPCGVANPGAAFLDIIEFQKIGYKVVTELMMHGPCGVANPGAACTKKGVCSKKCKSPDEVRTINGQLLPTYRAACEALGLLGDDKEWNVTLEESTVSATSAKLRMLFAQILFWTTAKSKTVNGEVQIHALVYGMTVIITESSVRRDLQLADYDDKQLDGLSTHKEKYDVSFHTKKVFANMKRIGKGFSCKKTPLFPRMVGPNQVQMGEDTTASFLDLVLQKAVSWLLLLLGLKEVCVVNNDSRKINTVVGISSSDDEALDKEDTSKQRRIDEIDVDEDITLVSTHDDELQDEGIEDGGDEEVVKVVTTAKMLIDTVVDAAQVTTAIADVRVSAAETIVTTAPTTTSEFTKTNVEVTHAPKRKGVMIQEPKETTTTKTTSSQQYQVQDKGKGKAKLIEKPMKLKKKDQILFDEEVARKLQKEIYEQERLVGERARQEEEDNSALIETWEDI